MDHEVLANGIDDSDERKRRPHSTIMGSAKPRKHNYIHWAFGLCAKRKFHAGDNVEYDIDG
jgi:hypothetical protein